MNVSRETSEKLSIYLELLKKWNDKINLVSPNSLKDATQRHFEDSLQLLELKPARAKNWADLGSGGGFPGAVVAIGNRNDLSMTLVESDQRKASFLRTVSRKTGSGFRVICKRIEDIPALQSDVISARALASLKELLGYAEQHLKSDGTALFPKGETWKEELCDAQNQWRFSCKTHKSETNPNAVILEIGELSRA